MQIGVQMNAFSKNVPLDKQIGLMLDNGFETTFCMSDAENAQEIITTGQKAGLRFETLHGPLGDINNMWKDDPSGEWTFGKILSAVKLCAGNGIPVLVVHLSVGRPAPIINDVGNFRYDALMEQARKHGVKIAFENSRCLGNIAAALERYEDACFCWDVGHEHCFTPGLPFLPYFADRVAALHLHDNLCELDGDLHRIPFDGKIDYERVAKELAASAYRSSIMLELSGGDAIYADYTPEQFYCRAAEAARKFAAMVKKYRNGIV